MIAPSLTNPGIFSVCKRVEESKVSNTVEIFDIIEQIRNTLEDMDPEYACLYPELTKEILDKVNYLDDLVKNLERMEQEAWE